MPNRRIPSRKRSNKVLRLALLSDTHELHREVDIPDADLLVLCGDVTMFSRSKSAILDLNSWLGELPHECIVIPGNHDSFLAADSPLRGILTNARVLINKGIEVSCLRIWGLQ